MSRPCVDVRDAGSKPEACEGCGFVTTEVRPYNAGTKKLPWWHWLCLLCANTKCGTAHAYPDQYPDRATLQAVCYVGNVILDRLDSRPSTRSWRGPGRDQ